MHIYSPSSVESINKIFDEAIKLEHPAYIRITKKSFTEDSEIHDVNHFVKENDDSKVLIISHGRMTSNASEVAKSIKEVLVYAMDKIKPLEKNSINELMNKFKKIIVIEDNFNS